jgi:hypothetical protein
VRDDQSRKPPQKVQAINRKQVEPDRISQEELRQASELQLTVWHAERQCREYILSLNRRIQEGAAVDDGELSWDADNQMVRSRRKEA